jgi:protein-S-isoprenylcysteine O-methyltransferase Ste14
MEHFLRPGVAIIALWIGWGLSWLAASAWSSRPQRRAGFASEIRHRAPLFLGAFLMVVRVHDHEGLLRLWRVGWAGAWVCAGFVATGIAFTWWARVYLGRLWSANVTLKPEHRVVDTGPYALVRHPIYTGLLLSLLATAVAKGTTLGVAGFALALFGFWLKARQEEAWLTEALGEAYADYRKRVPMLVPFLRV